MDEVATKRPSIATLEEIGTSTEGRPLKVLKLSNGPKNTAVFFESGIHGCEWAGPPVAMYAINQITENPAQFQYMLDRNDIYFLLVANPDGYVHSHEQVRSPVLKL